MKRRTYKTPKQQMKDEYRLEYWKGVRDGTIRRGVRYKHVVTSKKGEPLTFTVIYQDEPGYASSRFLIP